MQEANHFSPQHTHNRLKRILAGFRICLIVSRQCDMGYREIYLTSSEPTRHNNKLSP